MSITLRSQSSEPRKPSRHLRARAGFTLVEIIVVVIIIGVLATLIAPRILSRVGDSKQSVATANASNLATAYKTMMADCGWSRVPDGASIDALWEKPSDATGWKGPYVENVDALKDPWDVKYRLEVPGTKNVDFDIVSYGANKAPGGEGEDADIRKP